MVKRCRYWVTVLILAALVVPMFVSCASPGKNADVGGYYDEVISVEPAEIEAEAAEKAEDGTNWLSALGDISGLDIKSYQLRGEGPDGARFDWIEVTGTKVALSDVRRGQWTLYARAIGENGEILATGQLETFLSDSNPMGALYLDSEVGYGNARCSFVWNTFQVLYPEIEIYVKKGADGEYVPRDASEISIGDGVAVWNAHDIGAGSYIVRAILKDEGEVVAGTAAAMRIIDGKLSVGEVRFIVGKLSTIYGISLTNTPVATIRGGLEFNEGKVIYQSDSENLRYDWFLNGEYVMGYNEKCLDIASRQLPKGFYRVDCIVQNASDTSINSDSILVYADKDEVRVVTEDEADGAKDDVPAGYDEILTNSELPIEIAKGHVPAEQSEEPAEEQVEEIVEQAEEVEPVEVEIVEAEEEDPVFLVITE